MLQSIRDGSQGWITWIIVGLIAITFIAIGAGNYMTGSGSNDVIAKVEGRKITKGEVEKLAKRIMNQQKSDSNQTIDLNKSRENALKALTDNTILVNCALKHGFKVGPQQVVNFLNTVPDFQENGQFSPGKYRNILSHLDYTDLEFRTEIQNAILVDQLRQAFIQTSFKMPEEMLKAIAFEKQNRDFDFMIIPNALFEKEITNSPADVEQYYKNHKAEYLTEEKVKVEYLELELTEQTSEDAFLKKADQLIKLSFDHSDSLLPASDKLDLRVQQSPWLSLNNDLENQAPFNHPKILAAAFSDEVVGKMNSDVIQIDPKHYLVLRLLENEKSKQKPITLVKSDIEKILMTQAMAKKSEQLSLQLLASIKKGDNAKNLSAAKKYNLQWESVTDITRSNGNMPIKLIVEAFRLPKPLNNKIVASHLALTDSYHAVILLNKVSDGQLSDIDAAQKKTLSTHLENYAAQLEFELFAKGALKKATISKI